MLCPLGQLSSLLPLRCRSSRVIHSIGDRCHKEKTKTKKNKETRLVMRAGPERKKERRLLGSLSLCACQGSRRGGTHLGGSSVLEDSQCVLRHQSVPSHYGDSVERWDRDTK